jgi:hypothetical protein
MSELNIPAATINFGLFIKYNLNENLLRFKISTAKISLCIKGILNNFLPI